MLMTVMAELWTGLSRAVSSGLMITGGATCIWMPLSRFKPLDNKRILGVLICAALLITAAVKLRSNNAPSAATAATAPAETPTSPLEATAATQPAQGSIWPDPRAAGAGPSPAAAVNTARKPSASDLGDRYTDNHNGYSIQFPTGWTSRTFAGGDPWFVEVSDGKSGMISIGFSPFPSSAGVDQLKPDRLGARFNSRPHTLLDNKGPAVIDGQKGLWFRYTGPIDTATGRQTMECVHYYVPLHDGRMLELRLATPPDRFSTAAPLLRKSVATMKLLPL